MDGIPSHLLIAVLPLVAACGAGSVALYAWQRREVNGAQAFALCTASVFIWCFFAIFEQLAPEELPRIIFGKLQYFGIVSFPVLWWAFTLRYTQRDRWLKPSVLGLLSVIPVISLALALTDPWLGWVWKSVRLVTEPYPHLEIVHGWWFNYVMIPQNYVLLVAGFSVLLSASFSGSRLYRQQSVMLLIASLPPFVFNVLYVISGMTPFGLDLTPVGFAVSAFLIHVGLFRSKFLDMAPISYKTVFLNTADAVILLDTQRRIVDLNPSALTEGHRQLEMSMTIGQPFERIFPDYQMLMKGLAITDELTETMKLPRLVSDSRSGRTHDVFRAVKVRSLLSPGGWHTGWVVIIRDITLEKQHQAQLEEFAYFDSLTGLFNRRQLELKAEEIFVPCLDAATGRYDSIALLYIDLNHFKPINDKFGHDVGDAVLQYFARCLKNSVRQGDMVVRLGGDEFAAVVHESEQGVAMDVRSRLIKSLNQSVTLAGHRFTLSASIGIAYYPKDGLTLPALLRRADAHMYQEKRRLKKAKPFS
ncbi:MAG: histidine kinase N-terminal 7TM domain-containing protein [Cyanobacteria bacterium P01_D01_bin.105]